MKELLSDSTFIKDLETLSINCKKKPIVLFFGRDNFSDNTKYLFLACQRSNPNFEYIWCCWNDKLHESLVERGLPTILLTKDHLKHIKLLLRASFAVFCQNPFTEVRGNMYLLSALAGAKKIQLWHGISLKHLHLSNIENVDLADSEKRTFPVSACVGDFVASTARQFDQYWLDVFGKKQILRVGMTRNEVIFRKPDRFELIHAVFDDKILDVFRRPNKKILVAPTWQKNKFNWLYSPEFLEKLEVFGEQHDVDFFVKPHPWTPYIIINQLNKFEKEFKKYNRIFNISAEIDIYPWLNRFSAMISDYSSIMFDFLLTRKPTLALTIPDEERYMNEPDYSLIPDLSGIYFFGEGDFEDTLNASLQDHSKIDQQEQLISRLFESDPTSSCADLIRFIESEISIEKKREPVVRMLSS